jgi:omega-6 fatty acid desaturase (delta-12 desaturase)
VIEAPVAVTRRPVVAESARAQREFHADSCSEWRALLEPYASPTPWRSWLDVLTSVVPYLGLSAVSYLLLGVSAIFPVVLAPVIAVFLLRVYIVFHDCSHGAFWFSRRANAWLGAACGLLVLSPFVRWKHDHAVHHATAGDLDRRGVGDLPTLTVAEYRARDFRGRLGYRVFRHPLVMFGLGPVFAMIIGPRIVARGARPRMRRSVLWTDAALAVLAVGLCWLMGVGAFFLVWAPPALLSGAIGIWLFYVQHQFEEVYWERGTAWSYTDAALRGSSYLRLPAVLRFATGNIGFHHVHHMSTRIPNYNLKRAHDENPAFHGVPTLSLWEGLRAPRLKLWDEDRGRLVTFAEAATASPGGLR